MTSERSPRVPNSTGRVMILQVLADIRSGLASGLSFRALFDQLGHRLPGMSYRQFCRYGDRVRASMADPDLAAVLPRRPTDGLSPAAPVDIPAAGAPGATARPGQVSSPRQTEKTDGPKAPARPRGFVRRAGLPDDNKDKLV